MHSVGLSITCCFLLRFTARVCSIKILFFHMREKSQRAFFSVHSTEMLPMCRNHKLRQPTALNQYQPFFIFQYSFCFLLSNCVGRYIHTLTYDSCEGVEVSNSYSTSPGAFFGLNTPNNVYFIVLFYKIDSEFLCTALHICTQACSRVVLQL